MLSSHNVQAQSADFLDPWGWGRCEPDDLAREIVVPNRNAPLPNALPIQAEADRAESSETQSVLAGDVRLSYGNQRLRAERIIVERPANRVITESGFIYGAPRQAFRGQRADINLNARTGRFDDVDYYLPERNAQGYAETARIDKAQQKSQLEDVTYSTCRRGREDWQIRARDMKLNHKTGRGSARDITLRLRNMPLFYFPYLSFPITDERQSGFLFPRQGFSSETGLDVQIPYYWNIAPNHDMTITPRLMSSRGLLVGMEYRYLRPDRRGEISFEYLPYDRRYGDARGSFNIIDQAQPLKNTYTNLRFEYVSDDNYLKDLSNNLDFLTVNYLERHLEARYYGTWWQARARLQGFQILNPALFRLSGTAYQRLPQLRFDGTWPAFGNTGLSYQIHSEMVYFHQPDAVTGLRLDVWPAVAWTLKKPWGYIKPQAGFRYTGYQLNTTKLTAPEINRSPSRIVPVLDIDSGLFFERPLQTSWLGMATGTQTLEPRLYYLYVPYRKQSDIPLFDSSLMDRDYDWLFRQNRFTGADRLGDANQLTLALTTRLIDGTSGRERLSASIGQIQYFEDQRVTLTASQQPETAATSGLIAQGRLNLSSRWSTQFGLQMEPDNNDISRTTFDLHYYANPRQLFNISYLLDRNQPHRGLNDQIHSLDISFLWPINAQWRSMARWNQSLSAHRNLETLGGIEYEDCCWALRAVARQYRKSPLDADTQTNFYVELELKGLSRLGSGLETILRNSIFGYQPIRY